MRTLIGLALIGLVALVAVVVTQFDLSALRQTARAEPISLTIYYGGEKSAFLRNPQIRDEISKTHKIALDARKAGSVEMATQLDVTGIDCLWPSNAIATELAVEAGRPVLGDEAIFGSPIVFYAWSDVAEALAAKGIVSQDASGRLEADISGLGDLISSRARWKEDLGLDIYGAFRVFSTDPTKSNSGNIWSALLATVFNEGTPPTEADLPRILPRVAAYFDAMGYMESSSGDIFENFLKQGMGARPIIVGYENQLVEFLLANESYAGLISDKIRVIYPTPTIFASHPLIELTPGCKRLASALTDPTIQSIAWRDHGFRTGLIGVENDPAEITVTRLPETVRSVMSMPAARVMSQITQRLEE